MRKLLILLVFAALMVAGAVLAQKVFHRDSSTTGMSAVYSCPMHPEVQQKGPGNCPKCGMALKRS